jgi:hypothetical protein
MYPFNNDWTNSLFLSQDPVAIDSVMYDFLLAESNPCEGSQNYLHQSADPPLNVYDPENDGYYLSESLGVHEHWDTNENIFSSERYSGPSNDGIDYLAVVGGEELIVDAYGPYYGLINEPVQYNGYATGGFAPYTWDWDFGDGNSSDEQNPLYTYSTPDNYTITLTVTDQRGNTSYDYTWSWIQASNDPPDQPNIDGPIKGKPGTFYDYTFITNDPDGTEIWYYVDWGDNTNTGWLGPYLSGELITESHTWPTKGTYTIKCKAKDPYEAEGPWGELVVTMPRNKILQNTLYHILLEKFPNMFPILRHILGLL